MTKMLREMVGRLREDAGATMVEYGIMIALIAIVAIVAVQSLGTTSSDTFANSNTVISDTVSGSSSGA